MKVISKSIKNISSERAKRLAIEGSWVIGGQVASVLGTLVLVRSLTQFLVPAEYGKLALMLTALTLVNQLIMGGLISGIPRFYPIASEKNELKSYLKGSLNLMLNASLIVLALAAAAWALMNTLGIQDLTTEVVAVFVFSIFSSASATLNAVLNTARKRPLVAIHIFAESWLKILLILAASFVVKIDLLTVIVCYAVSSLLATVSQAIILMKQIQDDRKEGMGKKALAWKSEILKFALPFSFWGIFTWGQQASDRWSLEHFASTLDVGQYAVAFQLGYGPIGLLTGVLMSYLGPVMFQRVGSGMDQVRVASAARLSKLVSIGCLMLTMTAFCISLLFHDLIFKVLVGPAFRSASIYLPWIILAGGLFGTGQMLVLKIMTDLKISATLAPKIITAIIGIVLNILGAWKFGAAGVVGALVIYSLLHFLWMAKLVNQNKLVIVDEF